MARRAAPDMAVLTGAGPGDVQLWAGRIQGDIAPGTCMIPPRIAPARDVLNAWRSAASRGSEAAVTDPAESATERRRAEYRIVVFTGSLRRGSFNRALVHAARELAPDGMTIVSIEISDLPFYNADVEMEGDPPAVAAFKLALLGADGILIATPEYNDGIPAVLTNASTGGHVFPAARHWRVGRLRSWGPRRAGSVRCGHSSTSGRFSTMRTPGSFDPPSSSSRWLTNGSTPSGGWRTSVPAVCWWICSRGSVAGSAASKQPREAGLARPGTATRRRRDGAAEEMMNRSPDPIRKVSCRSVRGIGMWPNGQPF